MADRRWLRGSGTGAIGRQSSTLDHRELVKDGSDVDRCVDRIAPGVYPDSKGVRVHLRYMWTASSIFNVVCCQCIIIPYENMSHR